MKPKFEMSLRCFGLPAEASVCLAYAVVATGWIYFSDQMLVFFVRDPERLVEWSIYKGWFYVALTTVLLFWILRRIFRRIRDSQKRLVESEECFRVLFEQATDGILLLNGDLVIIDCNVGACQIYGVEGKEDLIGSTPLDFSPERQKDGQLSLTKARQLGDALFRGIPQRFAWQHQTKTGAVIDTEVSLNTASFKGQPVMQAIVRDVTDQLRSVDGFRKEAERNRLLLELYEQAELLSDRELYDYVLDHVVSLTESRIGFLHLVSDDQENVLLTIWNKEALKMCNVACDDHYPVGEAGNWIDCIHEKKPLVYNDFSVSPNQRGLPEGHVPVTRFMSVPVMESGKVRIVFGVGNKTGEYSEHDVVQLQLVANDLHKIIKQRQVEQLARESNERLQLAARSSEIGIWEYEFADDLLVWDDQMFRLYGVNPETFVGCLEDWRKTVHPADLQYVEMRFMEAAKQDVPFDLEFRIVWPDRSVHYLRAQSMFERDAEGRAIRSIGTNWDVTSQRVIVESLQENEEKYRLLFKNMTTGFALHEIICDEAGKPVDYRFLEINPAFERLTNTKAHELLGRTLLEVFPNSEPYWIEAYGKVALTGEGTFYENYSVELDRHYEVWAFCPKPGQFAVIFSDSTERKRTEEEMEKTKQQLQYIIDNTRDIIFQIDLKGNYIYANAAAERLTGYALEELLKMNMMELIAPEFQEHLAERLGKRVCGAAENSVFSFEIIHRAGHRLWVELATTPVLDEKGALVAIQGVARDITKRKENEQVIGSLVDVGSARSGQYFFQAMALEIATALKADYVVIGEYGTDAPAMVQTLAVCAHGGLGDNFKYSLEGTPCEGLAEGHPCSYVAGVADRFPADAMLSEMEVEAFVGVPLRNAQGEPVGLMVALYCSPLAKPEHMVSLLQAFSGRAGAEIERRRAEEKLLRLTAAINQADESVVITDTEGFIEYVNPAFGTISGYSPEEAVGLKPSVLKSGLHDDAFYKELWERISSGRPWQGRMKNKRKDGSLYTEESTISPVFDDSGSIVNYVAVKRDITRELLLEEQFLQSQKMEAVGRLAGGVAHDFNNILQTILGFCGILLLETTGQESLRQEVLEIQNAAKHAGDLTRQLLAFSRKQSVAYTKLNLNETIADSEKMLSRLLEAGVQLLFEPAPGLETVKSDASQIGQVVMNLVVNARDAMPNGGRIIIRTENVDVGNADVAVMPHARPGRFVCLSVSDSGTGMDKDVLDHLFEPFFTTKAVDSKGTGLGLAVIYGIVQQHKGWIDVESELGTGTTFRIYLPACDGNGDPVPPNAHAVKEAAGSCGRGERILLVEDDEEVNRLTAIVLRDAGYAVFSAKDAEQAMELFEQEDGRFDLLFSDVVLPDCSGIRLADSLVGAKTDLPVVLFSGYSDKRVRLEEIRNKGFSYLKKPFHLTTMLSAVRKAMADKAKIEQ